MRTRPLARSSFAIAVVLALGGAVAAVDIEPGSAAPHTDRVGIFVPRVTNATIVTSPAQVIAEARSLGVDTLRVEQNLDRPPSAEVRAFAAAGFDLVLTTRAGPHPGPDGRPTVVPPSSPDALARFRESLSRTLDATHPVLLAVENEEVGSPFVSGPVDDYLTELTAALDVGHDHGVPVTNGGITSHTAALLTWQDLSNRGMRAEADDFARRAFADPSDRALLADVLAPEFSGLRSQHLTDALARGTTLIDAYRKLPLDYVNFHWYIDDSSALRDVVEYLGRATGHEVVTHEIGQHHPDPAVVMSHLQTLEELGLDYVIWFDADGVPAVGLHDQPGQLRPNGTAFAARGREHGS